MPGLMSKPRFAGFALGLAAIAMAIRKHGDRTSVPPRYKAGEALFPQRGKDGKGKDGKGGRKGGKHVAVDRVFVNRVWRLLKIMCPGMATAEFAYAIAVALLLLARTWADVWMMQNRTQIEAKIITGNYKSFLNHLGGFVMAMVPVAIVNNMLKYCLTELNMRFRTRLTKHLIKEYLSGYTYYKISNIDNRIENADQLITQDVEKFCTSITELYSNLSKPLLDMALYSVRLTQSIGFQGPSTMLGYLALSGVALTWLRKPVGRFTVQEQMLEGEYRFTNSRLITHSEEVAFYNGNLREQSVIETTFNRLIQHVRKAQQFRFSMGFVDTLVAKYFATVVGFWVVSKPFFKHSAPAGSKILEMSHDQKLEAYYNSGRMLLQLAQAMGRLVLAGREMTRLAGFTQRITMLMDVLDDLNAGRYERTMVSGGGASTLGKAKAISDGDAGAASSGTGAGSGGGASGGGKEGRARTPSSHGNLVNQGEIEYRDRYIRFDNVPLATPNGDILVPSLNFEVKSGMNVLIAGPNGCGKSSLFRILGELWPLFGGKLIKPEAKHLFYIPQKPYLTLGTLRDQVIYPHTKADMVAAGITDDDLLSFMAEVQLAPLVAREGGWDAVQDWKDVLSGGEKQRVAMARVFYHAPQFAILDECTSAVSVDVEGAMYRKCRETGITLFTVSHRKSLWQFHEYVLQFDGRGAYDFRRIDDHDDVFGS